MTKLIQSKPLFVFGGGNDKSLTMKPHRPLNLSILHFLLPTLLAFATQHVQHAFKTIYESSKGTKAAKPQYCPLDEVMKPNDQPPQLSSPHAVLPHHVPFKEELGDFTLLYQKIQGLFPDPRMFLLPYTCRILLCIHASKS
jgi:hypothetical protein